MSIEEICRVVARLKRTYQEPDIFRLADAMGIIVEYEPMGKSENACKGFFIYSARKKHITINSDMPQVVQRIILAHEIGHAVLHRKEAMAGAAFHDVSMYETSKYEKEANFFAAELLLDDAEVIERLNDDTYFFGVAKELFVPAEMLDFKFRILKRKGWNIESPILSNSDFLKNITKRRDD